MRCVRSAIEECAGAQGAERERHGKRKKEKGEEDEWVKNVTSFRKLVKLETQSNQPFFHIMWLPLLFIHWFGLPPSPRLYNVSIHRSIHRCAQFTHYYYCDYRSVCYFRPFRHSGTFPFHSIPCNHRAAYETMNGKSFHPR